MKHDDQAHLRAVLLAGAILGFTIHFIVYVAVNLLLAFINLSTTPGYLWFKWPLLGWGIGLLIHGLVVFVTPGLRRRLVQRELDRDS